MSNESSIKSDESDQSSEVSVSSGESSSNLDESSEELSVSSDESLVKSEVTEETGHHSPSIETADSECQTEDGLSPATKKMKLDLDSSVHNDSDEEEEDVKDNESDDGFEDEINEAEVAISWENVTDKSQLEVQVTEVVIRGATFSITCSVHANQEGKEIVRLNVVCATPPLASTWSCDAKLSFKLHSLKQPIHFNIFHSFSEESPFANRDFVAFDSLVNRESGFVLGQEKKIVIKAVIKLVKIGSRVLEPVTFACFGFSKGCRGCHVTSEDGHEFCINPEYIKMYSPVLCPLLPHSNQTEVRNVQVKGIAGVEFSQFLNAVYPHHFPINEENAETLARIAFTYEVDFLQYQCETFMMNDTKSAGIPFLVKLNLACEYNMPRLQRKCLVSLKSAGDVRELRSSSFFLRTSAITKGAILNRLMGLEDWVA